MYPCCHASLMRGSRIHVNTPSDLVADRGSRCPTYNCIRAYQCKRPLREYLTHARYCPVIHCRVLHVSFPSDGRWAMAYLPGEKVGNDRGLPGQRQRHGFVCLTGDRNPIWPAFPSSLASCTQHACARTVVSLPHGMLGCSGLDWKDSSGSRHLHITISCRRASDDSIK